MKNFEPKTILDCISITCDRCKKTYDDVMEMQEFFIWEEQCGYGADQNIAEVHGYGDLDTITLDLCQYCKADLLGHLFTIRKWQ